MIQPFTGDTATTDRQPAPPCCAFNPLSSPFRDRLKAPAIADTQYQSMLRAARVNGSMTLRRGIVAVSTGGYGPEAVIYGWGIGSPRSASLPVAVLQHVARLA